MSAHTLVPTTEQVSVDDDAKNMNALEFINESNFPLSREKVLDGLSCRICHLQ
jgi:hypothetical protein